MSTKKIIGLAIATLAFGLYQTSPVMAQDEPKWQEYDLNYRTFRVSLFPGLNTNGLNAPNYAAQYSFNLLAGYNGALERGFEFGTLVNINKYYVTGVQIAGLANYSGEMTAGFQFAGMVNASGDQMLGLQLAGIANYSIDEMTGIQLAGIGNYSRNELMGIQLAGVGNVSESDIQGIQLSGLFNIAMEESQGVQAAGLFNYAKEDMQGLFWAGVGNYSGGEMQGLIFSGVFNISEDMQGIAATGVLNYTKHFEGVAIASANISKNMQGIQIGHINVADDAEGIQIGLINYAREFNGLPVGLISYYGNGRKNLDFWISDGGFTNVGIKLGTEEIYNMISIGYNPLLNRDVWQIGWSIGRHNQYDAHFFYNDFSYFKINEGGWTSDLNSIFKYRLLWGKELFTGFKVYGGPTFNLMISRLSESDDYTQYRIIDYEAKSRQYVFWIGFTLGTELF